MAVTDPHVQAPYGVPELAVPAAGAAAAPVDEQRLAEDLLWQRHAQGDAQAREALILRFLPYARSVAAMLYRQHVHHETEYREYVQWATLGLIEALDRYDPNRGARFTTYAHLRMLGVIRNGLEHISERQEQIGLRRRLAAERVAAVKRGRSLAPDEVPDQQLLTEMADVAVGLMLSFMLEETGMVQGPDSALPDGCYEAVAFKHEQRRLHELLPQLTPREQAVIRLHYLQGLAYDEIAKSLGITKGRISQLHEQALVRLRKLLAPDILPEPTEKR
jgi:RNA polymerase sigma factor for flagellar operon FliA